MKNSPLHNQHIKLEARMIEFGGWNMPVQYEGITVEHEHTRTKASIFDISHMGEFRVTGSSSGNELDVVFARQVSDIKIGACRYNFLLNEQGGVIDDLIVYRIAEYEYYIVCNASNTEIDFKTIQERLTQATIVDESTETIKIDLQGPESANVLKSFGVEVSDLPNYFNWAKIDLKGQSVFVSRTGYTGELGFEFYVPLNKGEWLWNLLLSNSIVKPGGLGARDTLRIEMGYALYGHELNLEINPKEIGFEATLKQREFIGNGILNTKTEKKLVAIELYTRKIARQGTLVFNSNLQEIGWVTSGTFSPSLKKSIAMAFINSEFSSNFAEIVLLGEPNKLLNGTIVEFPFYKNGTVRNKI